ncbi:alpha/beta hydrolase [Mesorhizobium sp. WSM4312]|uniref:alpha/beta fold hydrolase n=1 Tax=Mesorhizobium sp. WSM4312 TaxID=2029411 RepID=UPI000BB0126A|nr:alpha/beta hydrolase [Mesorhizobium sp. WSM4312]PBB69259.1 alpha/beta hydrolase [Mesorhizobium sp. WSM4312]
MEDIAVTKTLTVGIFFAFLNATSLSGSVAMAQPAPVPTKRPVVATISPVAFAAAKPTIVLVHGAFADGTGWQHIIPILQHDGYTVIAVQNALTSLADDIETTRRVIEAQKGPVVAVGHSYGGAVITGAAAGNDNVKALVYIAAFAPEAGEAIGAHTKEFPSALGPALRPDAAGFITIDPAQFRELFAKDVPAEEASVMAAAQKPIIGSAFASSVTAAAWKTIPSWYLVAQQDRAINPDLERFYAKRMGATTAEIKSSHVPFVSHPKEVARLIEQAASAPTN